MSGRSRNIPSLDGVRAVSILLVIIGHSSGAFAQWFGIPLTTFLYLARTGVSVFFVISGFLITNLLLQELQETETIRLGRFYTRRAFRIFPPFYFYLAIIFALTLLGVFHTPLRPFFFTATYIANYYGGGGGDFVGLQHIWSLCIEEQFYLLWPAALLWLGKRRATYLAIWLILLSPFSRLATYFLAPQHRAGTDRMFHSSVDTIMFGCLLALVWKEPRFREWTVRWIYSARGTLIAVGALVFLLVLDPLLAYHLRSGYYLLVGLTLQGISICFMMLYVVDRPRTLAGRLLNTRLLCSIGVVSYSLYLWQNIVIGLGSRYFPFDLVVLLACALFSYFLIERPSFRLRDRLLQGRRTRRVVEAVSGR